MGATCPQGMRESFANHYEKKVFQQFRSRFQLLVI